jgi:hypothetical protein
MIPTRFDSDVEMHYKSQRAQRDAERYRLARLAAGPRSARGWQVRLERALAAGLTAWASGTAFVKQTLARPRASRVRVGKPRQQCC